MKMATEPSLVADLGLWLISDRPKGSDFESFPRRAQCPRYRQRGLVPWQPKLIEARATSHNEYPQHEQSPASER